MNKMSHYLGLTYYYIRLILFKTLYFIRLNDVYFMLSDVVCLRKLQTEIIYLRSNAFRCYLLLNTGGRHIKQRGNNVKC